MDDAIVKAFQSVAKLHRSDLFDDDRLMPWTASDDANTAAPGWAGAEWHNGTLLIGINPGGGGDNYRRNAGDGELYAALRAFGAASTERAGEAFRHSSDVWMRLQRGHNIWRIVGPILGATGESVDEVSFINILPFRTRNDAAAPVKVLRKAWEMASGRQVSALQPRRIIALGKKAWDVLDRLPRPAGSELLLFKRGIGDSYIPAESQELLRALSSKRLG